MCPQKCPHDFIFRYQEILVPENEILWTHFEVSGRNKTLKKEETCKELENFRGLKMDKWKKTLMMYQDPWFPWMPFDRFLEPNETIWGFRFIRIIPNLKHEEGRAKVRWKITDFEISIKNFDKTTFSPNSQHLHQIWAEKKFTKMCFHAHVRGNLSPQKQSIFRRLPAWFQRS